VPFYRITQWWNPGGRGDAQFTLRFETDITVPPADQLSLVNAWTASWFGDVPGLYCADIAWGSPEIAEYERVVPGAPDKPYFRDVTVPIIATTAVAVGAVAGHSLPPQIALVVGFGTSLAGRSRRGRIYTPNPPESVSDGSGAISSAAAISTAVEDGVVAVEGVAIGVDVDHIVHSATHGYATTVTSYTANAQADTQRRRAR